MSDTPRTVAVCEKLIAWATKNPNATIGDAVKFIVETFTEDMAEVERELNEAQKTITEFREWSIGGVAASEWKNRAETAEAKLAAKPDVAELIEDCQLHGLHTAADALLSLSAQLAEKEAALKQLDESFEQRTQELIKAEAEFEAERNIVMRMWEASGLDPAYSIDDQFEKLRKDAERYYDLRDNDRTLEYCRYWEETLNAPDGPFQTLDAAIDAAIAARDCAVYKPLPKEVRDGILTLLTK